MFKGDEVEPHALEGSKEKVWLGLVSILSIFQTESAPCCIHTRVLARVESGKGVSQEENLL